MAWEWRSDRLARTMTRPMRGRLHSSDETGAIFDAVRSASGASPRDRRAMRRHRSVDCSGGKPRTLKPIDNVSLGKTTSHRAVTTVNAKVASKVRSPEGRVLNRRAKAAWGSRKLTDAAPSLRRGGSDSTVTRTCRATGETLLVPARNRRSRVDRITGSTGNRSKARG